MNPQENNLSEFQKVASDTQNFIVNAMQLIDDQKTKITSLESALSEAKSSLENLKKSASAGPAFELSEDKATSIVNKLVKIGAVSPEYMETNIATLRNDPNISVMLLDRIIDTYMDSTDFNQGVYVKSASEKKVVSNKIPQVALEDIEKFEREHFNF